MTSSYCRPLSAFIRKCAVLSLLMLASCTHTIRHVPGDFGSQGTTGEIDLVMSPEVSQRIIEQKIGINLDKWRFEIGAAVSDLLPKALRTEYAKVGLVSPSSQGLASSRGKAAVPRLVINSVDLDLSAGATVFSSHEVSMTLGVAYLDSKGLLVFDKKISGSGAASGADRLSTWGGFIETTKFTQGMNEALDVAVTNSILAV